MNKYIENVKIEKIENSANGKNFILQVYLSKDVINAPRKALRHLFDDQDTEVKDLKYKIKEMWVYIPKGIECIKESMFESAFCEYGYGDIVVIIPEGVKKVEKRAFYYAHFDSLKLPESLEYIGDEAFYTYTAFKESVLISQKVKHIGQNFISADFIIDKENENFFDDGVAIYNVPENALIYFYPDVKKDVYSVREGTQIISASGLYRKNYFIDEIIIPESVEKIEKCLWRYNEFKKVTVKNKETLISWVAFNDNTKILYPDGEYFYIGHSSKFCKEDDDKIKYYNYENTKVTQARKNAIEKIEEEGNSLNIYFSENIQSDEGIIFRHLFNNDYDNVSESIKKRYIEGYYHDIYVYLPDGITYVKERMFSNAFVNQKDNKKIESKVHIIIGEGVEKIEESAFYNSGAYSVKLPQSLEVIEEDAFCDRNITQNIKIPENVKVIEEGAFRINGNSKIIVDKNNETFYSDGYALYNVDEKELIYFFAHKSYKDYKEFDEAYNFNYRVLDGTKKIYWGAFVGFSYYDSDIGHEERFGILELPESIEKIERWTFIDTVFKKVIINNPDVVIENYAFLYSQKIDFPFDGYLIVKNYEEVKVDGEYRFIDEIPSEDLEKYNKIIYDYEIPEEKEEPKEVYQGEETELDIDEIKRKLEENKKELETETSKNPFDFDADEIFKDVDYDYNPFDFEPAYIEEDDDEE